ncbi:MAG: 4-hydroxythreonine-4-phosphate dehydrogenase PdxA [Myxococcales bacterium FL481]|nr:MAG: 4-hydroxythreonine-4-phosphate dehydrogenase PdxA [Myxococcales bacterium FL481]
MRRLVLTQGDPDGIGPELLLRVASLGGLGADDRVVAGREHLSRLVATLNVDWARQGWARIEPRLADDVPPAVSQVAALARGVDAVLMDSRAALVTAPIDKAACVAQGFRHPGHTEYLAARAETDDVAMLLVGPRLRVALATIHIPLSQVPRTLDETAIVRAGTHLLAALRQLLGVRRPRIGVLGLNPHAGEQGVLGDDEPRVIEPAVAELRRRHGQSAEFLGPLPADAAFPQHAEGRYDGVVAMYHDQGLAPFKLLHVRDGVNLTMGLPFVRTSPDHGTAKDIAGQGVADPSSMLCAIRLARGEAEVWA